MTSTVSEDLVLHACLPTALQQQRRTPSTQTPHRTQNPPITWKTQVHLPVRLPRHLAWLTLRERERERERTSGHPTVSETVPNHQKRLFRKRSFANPVVQAWRSMFEPYGPVPGYLQASHLHPVTGWLELLRPQSAVGLP